MILMLHKDSVPKFLKEDKYRAVLQQHNFDHAVAQAANAHQMGTQTVLPERSRSKAIRDRDTR